MSQPTAAAPEPSQKHDAASSPHSTAADSPSILNSAAVLLAKQQLVVQPMPLPSLGAGDVMIEMKAVGICGSDVHYQQHGRIGDFVVREPMVLGHEAAGRVVALGAGVTNLAVGDRVAIEPGIGCGTCELCSSGRYNLCAKMRFLATPPVHGALCNLLVHPAHLCFPLPAGVSYEEGALCEPLSVALYAARRAGLALGQRVLITGAGPIGLLVAMVAQASGAGRIVLMDVSQPRLRMAQELLGDGVTVVHVGDGESQADTLAKVRAATGSEGVHVAFECSGAESATTVALQATRSGGCLLLIGLGASPTLALPLASEVLVREVDVRGIFRYTGTYPQAIAMIASKRIPVARLITHRVQLRREEDATVNSAHTSIEQRDLGVLDSEKVLQGFEAARTAPNAIKVMFTL